MNTLIANFSIDTENAQNNFQLANFYHDLGQTASAISYYLRCAERTDDILVAYDCLILMSLCFQQQKDRDFTAEHMLKHAISICGTRPEAYYWLAKLLLNQNKYYEAYMFSSIALNIYDVNKYQSRPYIAFDIYSHILLIKGICAPYWEKNDEAIDIFNNLYNNYYNNFDETNKNIILDTMKKNNISIPLNNIFMKEYLDVCDRDSDINQHLPYLLELAKQCDHITEFGVRYGDSTKTFLYSNKILRSYDLMLNDKIQQLFDIAEKNNKNVKYIQSNVLNIDIEQTDMLFIDTWHQYDQLKQELSKHSKFVNKYIVLHDTFTFGLNGEHSSGCGDIILTDHLNSPIGLLPALIEFMIEHPEWKFKYNSIKNNGLTVIERIIKNDQNF